MAQNEIPSRNWNTAILNLTDGVLVTSKTHLIQFVNDSFCNFFGIPQPDLIGKDIHKFFAAAKFERPSRWETILEHSLSPQRTSDYLLQFGAGSKVKYFRVSFTHLEHDSANGFTISIWRDISKRKEKELALKPANMGLLNELELTDDHHKQAQTPPKRENAASTKGTHTLEISAINQIARKVHASLSVQEVVNITLNEFKSALDLDLVFLFLREKEDLALAGWVSETVQAQDAEEHWVGKCFCSLAAETNQTVFSHDLLIDHRCTQDMCKNAGIQSLISIPIYNQESNIGAISLASLEHREFGKVKVLLEGMASQASIAISNARLYEQARERISEGIKVTGQLSNYQLQLEEIIRKRTEELQHQYKELQNEVAEREKAEIAEREQRTWAVALEKTAAVLNSTLDLDEVLDSILASLENVIPHDSANIMLINPKDNIAFVARYKGNPKVNITEVPPTSHFPIYETPTLFTMIQSREPFVIPDVKNHSAWIDQIGSDWIRSYIAAPILYGEEVLGFLNLVSDTPNFYQEDRAYRLQAFANHASIAIRNARLYDQAGEIAVLEERQRLAREMHDAVSQTLFTANVIAEALPVQWDRDPEKGKEGLSKLQDLVQGALAEVRTILVELRPEAISKSDLGELIGQIAHGARSYSEITLSLDISGNHLLPEEVQLAFFRITQEVFNNIVKHARASHVKVDFQNSGDKAFLRIQDNGRGFDKREIKTGRFGITIMKERASSIGAKLVISSELDQGTTIQLVWEQS